MGISFPPTPLHRPPHPGILSIQSQLNQKTGDTEDMLVFTAPTNFKGDVSMPPFRARPPPANRMGGGGGALVQIPGACSHLSIQCQHRP